MRRAADERTQGIMRAHLRLLERAAAAQGGATIRWLGDGLLAAFAAPEDAVRTAARLQRGARRRPMSERLDLRVGLHLGPPLRHEADYFGTAVAVVRRVCGRAGAGEVTSSRVVAEVVAGEHGFSIRDRGTLAGDGLSTPIAVCEILYRSEQPGSLLANVPFVGRVAELRRLRARLDGVRDGDGGVVMVAGEPGVGKTRILEELAESARADGMLVLAGRCQERDDARSYAPFAEALAGHLRGATSESLAADVGAGAPAITRLVPELRDRLPDVPDSVDLRPDEARVSLFDAVTQLLLALAARTPVVLLLDDLHWVDAATVGLLRHLAGVAAGHRLLLVGAYRDVELRSGASAHRRAGRLAAREHLSARRARRPLRCR